MGTFMNELMVFSDIRLPVQRIVSLAPSITEILFYLGFGEHLVGVTRQCDYPRAIKEVPIVGSFLKPDIKRITELSPDIIIGLADLHKHLPEVINSGQINHVLLDYHSVSGVLDTMDVIAGLAEDTEKASEHVTFLRRRVNEIQMKTLRHAAVRTLFMMYDDPVYTPGCGSYQYDALKIAGAAQMPYNNTQYERITIEQVVEFDPEVIFACGRHRNEPPRKICPGCQAENPICLRIVDDIAIRPRWQETWAARRGRILALPCDWLCRAGPRLINGIEKISEILGRIDVER
jgi:iron complex transport system substrate-binding protein